MALSCFTVNELEDIWTTALAEAERRAQEQATGEIADYVRLRQTNDAARNIGIEWLHNAFLEVAAEANRRGANIIIEKADSHRFPVGTATMVGSLVRLRFGVRSVTIEAGFPRSPQDGFVRGGGLAAGRITHFGFSSANADLLLVRTGNDAPRWFAIDKNNLREPFSISHLKRHFAVFLDQS